jgi:LmbE family N-acetylglucosaminyl deacetylase
MIPASVSDSSATSTRSVRERLAAALLGAGRKWSLDPALDLNGSALVFAPHPDDEVLGCGGTIALKASAGVPVHVVVMTDGRTSHAGFVDAPTLVEMRRAEALDASRQLGLEPSAYTFLDFEDNCLVQQADLAQRRVAELLQRHRPQQVFVPHRHDGLSDHVATREIVASAAREWGRPMTLLEYPVWLWNTWPFTATLPAWRAPLAGTARLLRDSFTLAFACRTRVDVRMVLPLKRAALAQYRSQVQRQRDDPKWPILSDVSRGAFLECFYTGTEVFRRSELGGR